MRLNIWSLGVVFLVLPAFGAAPFSSLRFLDEQSLDSKVWRETAAMLKANRAACDEVWFSTGIGVASLDRHRRMSAAMARAAEYLRPAGIVPSVQFQATMGHSDAIALRADCTGKAWSGFTGRDGTRCELAEKGVGLNVHRDGETTVYDIELPKSVFNLPEDLFGGDIRLALKIDDNDGEGRDYWMGMEDTFRLIRKDH